MSPLSSASSSIEDLRTPGSRFWDENQPSSTSGRRPSWTPSILADDDSSHIIIPPRSRTRHGSQRRAARIDVENLPLSFHLERGLAARRPSFAPQLPPDGLDIDRSRQRYIRPTSSGSSERQRMSELPSVVTPESPEDGNFRRSLEINMKDLVGDAVGNMSISPASRDVVLAARRGLFIIDLEAPFEVPRFLPQGGTWDVADVQWNPHPSRAEYIVSTSSEKLLIWNLLLVGKTSIQHILRSHYRAITDINWHTTECDTVVSTGIDSWLWAWDLREPRKPIFGLSAFKAAGTQVKWNRQDGNILASSHSDEVLIWDRRKGSLPVTQIRAHTSKIYGIDWSHHSSTEIVTCSLDKTIKTWDTNDVKEPTSCIRTTYPVWRARTLPFGEGVLGLPQRGETTLEMYATAETHTPVETFEGHTDVVKEFVWRKGGRDEFQLITWSKDRTLRFWPIGVDVMQRTGHILALDRGRSRSRARSRHSGSVGDRGFPTTTSFRNLPLADPTDPHATTITAPVGHRAILAGVRAPLPPTPQMNPDVQPHPDPRASFYDSNEQLESTPTMSKPIAVLGRSAGERMSRGGIGKSIVRMDPFSWLANVKVGSKRGSSSGAGSGGDSNGASRVGSMSRAPSGVDVRDLEGGGKGRSGSRNRGAEDGRREGEGSQSSTLQDEITTVLTKLAASKIKLEKHDLTRKRSCTLGLHGPWGETSSVFMRITFTFPRDYPQATHPRGTPSVELEKNPLISVRDREFILKRLRTIRERKRPCLEACLRFLLFAEESIGEESGSSSEDDGPSSTRKPKDFTVSLMRNIKNLAEPRTSQGTFGPNGELITFFRAPPRLPPRLVRNVLIGLTETSSVSAEEQHEPQQQQQTRYLQSPALVSDAVRRLGLSAQDREVKPLDPLRPENSADILRAMTNLLTVSKHKMRRDSDSRSRGEILKDHAFFATRRSNVFMTDTTNIAGGDKKVALDYVFQGDSLSAVCETNATVAREHGRYDHERVFRTLRTLFRGPDDDGDDESSKEDLDSFASDSLARRVITRIHSDLCKGKDVQMLAMLSMLVLQTSHGDAPHPAMRRRKSEVLGDHLPPLKIGGLDYFSITKSMKSNPPSPQWPYLPSPIAPTLAPSLSSSNSSRGSWSSLFNAGGMRQFMNGVQDSFKEGLITPLELPISTSDPQLASLRAASRVTPESPGPKRRRMRLDSVLQSPNPALSRSWNDTTVSHPLRPLVVSFSSTGQRRPAMLRLAGSIPSFLQEKEIVVFEPPPPEHESPEPLFTPDLVNQFMLHVSFYAEMLFRWQLFNKRLELLKAVNRRDPNPDKTEPHKIGLVRVCARVDCKMPLPDKATACQYCGTPSPMACCTVCRLPVKGLSCSCVRCYHVTHISCWNSLDVPICPSGCGCFCSGYDGPHTRPSTRLGMTPPITSLVLS